MDEFCLFADKKDCCGCGACEGVCPQLAISMRADEEGFVYPLIDQALCVRCGLCKQKCAYQNLPLLAAPQAAYAAAAQSDEILMKTASGGIFTVLAQKVLEDGGVVFGAAMVYENEQLVVRHMAARNLEELAGLQGSKYVHSQTGDAYRQAQALLQQGTPRGRDHW